MSEIKKYMRASKRFASNFYPVNVEKRIGTDLPTIEVNYFRGKFLLDGANVNYSFGSLHRLFLESFKYYKLQHKQINNVLILGFGAGSVAHILQREFGMKCHITGIEIDPVVLELGSQYFDTNSYENTEIKCTDAFDFVQNDTSKYDLIIVDLFIEKRVPVQFLKAEFLYLLKSRLADGAYLFYNKMTENQLHLNESIRLKENMVKIFKHEIDSLLIKSSGAKNTVFVYHDEKVENPDFVLKSNNIHFTL